MLEDVAQHGQRGRVGCGGGRGHGQRVRVGPDQPRDRGPARPRGVLLGAGDDDVDAVRTPQLGGPAVQDRRHVLVGPEGGRLVEATVGVQHPPGVAAQLQLGAGAHRVGPGGRQLSGGVGEDGDHVDLEAGQAVQQQGDLLAAGPGEQVVGDDDRVVRLRPLLAGPLAQQRPGAFDLLALEAVGRVQPSQLQSGAARLVGAARGDADADLGQGGGVVAQRPGEGASACVGEADVDHEPALGHARRVAGAGERQVNGRWWPGRRAV